jgi:hypothetical protein
MGNEERPFSETAFPINQSGRLTDEQTRRWANIAKGRRDSVRGVAYVFAALGAFLLFANGPAASATARANGGLVFLAIAAVMFFGVSLEPVNADVREGRVESVDGAIAKASRSVGTGGARTSYRYFDIAGRRFRATPRAYDAAPAAGYVRVYFLPRSRRVVNLEQLPDPTIPTGSGAAREIMQDYARALGTLDRTTIAEANARLMALKHVVEGPPPHATLDGSSRSSRLRADDLYGTWTNPMFTVAFMKNGVATMTTAIGGIRRDGHWSVDANGRLLTDATGTLEPMEASLEGPQLTITIEGQRVTFSRSA